MAKPKLKYSEPLLSTSDNFIPTAELLSRLEALHQELSSTTQGEVDLSTVDIYRDSLINQKLTKHKDLGIRAFVACCLSDILRLYAPDAPYTETQLTEIFKLVLAQFEKLGEPDNGYYIQQTYLITRLLEYRSIVLLTDLPSSSRLLENLFEIFYDDTKNFKPKLFKVIGGILGEVISEFDSVPMDVLKMIFNKFLTYNPNDVPEGLGVASNCGYEVSLILCDSYSGRMSRHLTKYYSDTLYHITGDNENTSYESKRSAYRTVEKLHRLVVRLWENVSDLVSAVIGFIYHELLSQNETLRKQATKLVGSLLSTTSSINFVTTHEETFKVWLSKIADVSFEVRQEWVACIPQVLSSRYDISEEISKGLAKTLIDSEYRVRKASVIVFEEVEVERIWNTIRKPNVLSCLLQLTREKNREVREVCIPVVAQFYSGSLQKVKRTDKNSDIWDVLDGTPRVLFELYYINDPHINEQADEAIFKYLLPTELDNEKRVKRILDIVSHFDKKAFASFFAFNKRQLQMSLALSKYVDSCEELASNESSQDKDEMFNKFKKTIEWLSLGLADQQKGIAALEALKLLGDKRIFYLIKTCIANDVAYPTLVGCMKELLMKLQDSALFRKNNLRSISNIMPKEIAHEMEILLYRASPLIYNLSNVQVLLNRDSGSTEEEIEMKRRLLDNMAETNPSLFKDQVRNLKIIIENYDVHASEENRLGVEEGLKTLFKISKKLNDQLELEDTVLYINLKNLAIHGNPFEAKYAVKIIAISPNPQEKLNDIKSCLLPLDLANDTNISSHIMVLAEIFKYYPEVLEQDSTDIVGYLIKEVLLKNQVTSDSDHEPTWIDNSNLNESRYSALSTKLFALKLFANKLKAISVATSNDELASAFTEKTMKLFFYLIASGGELISEQNKEFYPTPTNFQTKLRCMAGLQVLKLARIPALNGFIHPQDTIKLINLVEDESLPVRKEFLDHLKHYISSESISIKFLSLVFFTAYEPDTELKSSTKIWINCTFSKKSFKKNTFFERALPRLIHAVAHHPDIIEGFGSEGDPYLNILVTAVDYLLFYFDSIASQENFSLLYYLAERVKNYKDAITVEANLERPKDGMQSQDESEYMDGFFTGIYIVGEIAQMILLSLKERQGWQHSAYPGKLNLPADLFSPFATVEDARDSFKTYLDDKHAVKLRNIIRAKVNRSMNTSQTQRQKAQKRLLQNEYHEIERKKKRVERTIKRSEERQDNNGDYLYTSPSKRADKHAAIKKNLRVRKEINYRDEDDDLEDDDDDLEDDDDVGL